MTPVITVAIAATYEETRLLAMRGPRAVLRARLASPTFAHRWTMPLLLESLALGWQQPLRVVLCAESAALSSGLQLTGHVTEGVYRRYAIPSKRDRNEAAHLLAAAG